MSSVEILSISRHVIGKADSDARLVAANFVRGVCVAIDTELKGRYAGYVPSAIWIPSEKVSRGVRTISRVVAGVSVDIPVVVRKHYFALRSDLPENPFDIHWVHPGDPRE